jgi:hypothetical protein
MLLIGKLYDLGEFMVLPDTYVMVVSQSLMDSSGAKDKMVSYHGTGIIPPQSKAYFPSADFLH